MNHIVTSIPSPTISYFDVGPFRVHFYALLILAGIVLAVIIANRRLSKRGAQSGVVLDIALWAVPFGIVGGRFYHVVTHWNDYFFAGSDLTAVFRIWEGGLAIYGALIFGALGAWIGARFAGIRFWSFVDALAPGLLLAQAIGRWGNYFNNELFGNPTDLPWGLEIASSNNAYPRGLPDGVLFHPTFLYESIWSLVGVLILLALDRRFELRWGKLFALYLAYYSFGRIWIENIRIDPSEIAFGIRTNVWSALAGIAIGIVIFAIQLRRHPTLESSVYLVGREPLPVSENDEESEVAENLEMSLNNPDGIDSKAKKSSKK
jgi:prolipoprotein diacylglyceryl transferase